jgi:hypothetical protein
MIQGGLYVLGGVFYGVFDHKLETELGDPDLLHFVRDVYLIDQVISVTHFHALQIIPGVGYVFPQQNKWCLI